MEIFISAFIGELVTRSMSSIISKCSKPPLSAQQEAMEVSLERILCRGQVIIDEAAGRHITNQAMLRQLTELSDALYKGYHVLDTFRCRRRQACQEDEEVLCLFSNNSKMFQELEESFHGLRAMIEDDASEMVMFLTTYPRLYRQPYIMHLLLDKCMFGRQMEMQLVINFLLCSNLECSYPKSNLECKFDVLPIVGPGKVGKSTLVAHVCDDERVRDHFSHILFFSHGSFRGEEDIATLRDRCASRYENNNNSGRLLVVVDIASEIDDDLYERLSSLCQQSTTSVGSKIIITSQSDKITKLGTTTHALTLKYLSHEAYWYFLKVITFGSTDPEMHPKLMCLAMEIARTLNGNLIGANIMACLLRDNFNIDFWCKILAFRRRYVHNHLSEFGKHPDELIKENKPTYIQPMGKTINQDIFILDRHRTCSSEEEVPKMKFQDVVFGSMVRPPQGPFKVLAWKSGIPPYYRYTCTCEIQKLQARAAKRKRAQSLVNGVN